MKINVLLIGSEVLLQLIILIPLPPSLFNYFTINILINNNIVKITVSTFWSHYRDVQSPNFIPFEWVSPFFLNFGLLDQIILLNSCLRTFNFSFISLFFNCDLYLVPAPFKEARLSGSKALKLLIPPIWAK